MIIRRNARIVVLNPGGAVLLVRHRDAVSADPENPDLLTYWVPPGGGVDDGESFEQAAIRELEEETGIEVSTVGPHIWSRQQDLIHDGQLKRHMERYFMARAESPSRLLNRTMENIEEIRWWTLDELRASAENFLPQGFIELVARVMAGDVASAPIDIV